MTLNWKEFAGYGAPSVAALGAAFAANVIVARIIGPENFGKYNLIISYGQVFLWFTSLGLSTAVIKYLAEVHNQRDKAREILSTSSGLTMIACLLTIGVGLVVKNLLPINTTLWDLAMAWGIIMAWRFLVSAQIKALQKLVKHGWLEIGANLVTLSGLIWVAVNPSVMSAWIVDMAGKLVFILAGIKLVGHIGWEINREMARNLIKFSVWVTLGSVLSYFSGYFDRIIVNQFLGTRQLGIYSAYSMFTLLAVGYLATVAVGYLYPKISAVSKKREILDYLNKLLIIGSVPLWAVLTVATILGFSFLGKQFEVSWTLATAFAGAATISLGWQLRVPVLQSLGDRAMRYGTLTSVVNTVAGVGAMLTLTPKIGVYGLIAGQVILSIGAIIFQNYYFRRELAA